MAASTASKTPDQGVLDDLRTIDRRGGTRHPPRLQIERVDSPLAQFSFRASSDVFPWHTGRLAGDHPAGSPLDFSRPRGFNFGEVVRSGIVQTSKELGRDVGTFSDRQGQGFTKKFLRS
jgi:hypothetical protein